MPREIGLPKYFDFKTTPAGTKLVTMGEYIGATEGRFGLNHSFLELQGGQQVVLSGKSLDWRVTNEDLVEGKVYDITFGGREVLKKGKFEGKEVNNFNLAVYCDEELVAANIQRSGAAAPKPAGVSVPMPEATPIEAPASDPNSLDDLD